MRFLSFLCIVLPVILVHCKYIVVTNSDQLSNALTHANFNDTIHMQDGIYNGNFIITRKGYSALRITLTGSKNAIITSSNFGLHQVDYWSLRGFTVQNSTKGIVLHKSSFNTLDDLHIFNTDEEGISLTTFSNYNVIENCKIHDTGRKRVSAAISVGRAVENWEAGQADVCARNDIFNNIIGPNIPSECVDLKEGTIGSIVRGNYFNSRRDNGEAYSNSSVSVKGTFHSVENNTSDNSKIFGFDVIRIYATSGKFSGCGNNFLNNQCKNLPIDGICASNQAPDCNNTFLNNVII